MSRINRLSSEQLELLRQVRDEWEQVYLDTTPVDLAQVREVLGRLYALADKPAPKQIIFLGSPLQVLNAAVDSRRESQPSDIKTLTEIRYQAFMKVLAFIRYRFPDYSRYKVWYQVRTQVREQICKQFSVAYSDMIFFSFIELVQSQFVKQVRTRFSQVAAFDQTDRPAYCRVAAHLRGHILDEVFDQVEEKVCNLAHACFVLNYEGAVISQNLMNITWGINPWISWQDFFSRLGLDASGLRPFHDMAKICGWYILTEHQAFVSAKPDWIKLDDRQRLHCETGPAIRYPDGFSVFAIHGVRVPNYEI